MDDDLCKAWCELIAHKIRINSTFRASCNADFEATLPTNSVEDPVEDFEPHLHCLGSYDEPDLSMFAMFDDHPSRRGDCGHRSPPIVAISEVAHAARLAVGDHDIWSHMLSLPSATGAVDDGDDHFVWRTGDDRTRPLPRNLRRAIFDFGGFDGNASAALLCLFLAMPGLEAASLRHIRSHHIERGSLFGCFPAPRAQVASMWSVYGVPAGLTVAAKLTSLHLTDCHLTTADMYFLGDCAIENAVLPMLRDVALDHSHGAAYGSIVALAQATNFAFDRSRITGATCPQECVNPKNLVCFY